MKVFNENGELLTLRTGAIPGVWKIVGNGSTAIANDTEIALINFTPNSNEVYFYQITLREPGNLSTTSYQMEASTDSVGNDNEINYAIARPASSGLYEFRVRHKLKADIGGAISGIFDWVLYKVVV